MKGEEEAHKRFILLKIILFQLYIPFYLPWKLIGEREQVYTINRNITELTSVRQKLPMLAEYLKMDFTKYYK